MVEFVPQNPNSLTPPATSGDPPPPLHPPPATAGCGGAGGLASIIAQRPAVRVTSEFEGASSVFLHKISCKLMENLAKLKLSFRNNIEGRVADPQLSFTSKYVSVVYDVEEKNALVKGSFEPGPGLLLRATRDIKAQQGEVAMVADLAGPAYKIELSSPLAYVGLPKTTLKFPLGEVSFVEKEVEKQRMLSMNGILTSQVLNGVCTAQFMDENLNLRYSYKDEQLALGPCISLPSNAPSLAFKRRFGPSDKLSYLYNFDSNFWSAVYKHTVSKDYKFKAGYNSGVRLGWASILVGDEAGKAKTSPKKMIVQLMLQVPQDNIRSSNLTFRVKKRWDV